ncbi:unnamed protein product [Cochlearia groenlandica]
MNIDKIHIFGLGFLHLLLTSTALFLSTFFFKVSSLSPSSKSQSSKQEKDQEQDQSYVATKDILKTSIVEEEDGEIPDDESLIELSLPSGHYLGHNHFSSKKNNVYIHNKVVQDFKFFDLFIEEDNLIEIDISIGSIKYSRFEIKA